MLTQLALETELSNSVNTVSLYASKRMTTTWV